MFSYYPAGLPVHYCSFGHPVIAPTEIVRVDGKIYCAEHAPQPEPSEDIPETPEWQMSPRRRKHIDFQKFRYERGDMAGDDYPEPLTDSEADRLARHVLP